MQKTAVLVIALVMSLGAASSAAAPKLAANGPIVFSTSGDESQVVTADLKSHQTKVIVGLQSPESAVLSPGRRFVAYWRWVGDYPASAPQVFVRRTSGGPRNVIATGCDPAWSPSGKELAFIRVSSSQEFCTRADLVVSSRDGSQQSVLESGYVSKPAWSPDGRWISFLRWTPSLPQMDLYVVRPDGAELRLVAENVGDTYSWSPDSTRVAVIALHPEGGGSLETQTLGGEPPTVLADSAYRPQWSPNGRWISYEDEGRLFAVNVQDDYLRSEVGTGSEGAWVGDDQLAFNSTAGIRVAAIDRSSSRLVIKAPAGVFYHDLRALGGPHGIVFRRETIDYGAALYAVSEAGRSRRLTSPEVSGVDPSVSPDGRTIAFTRVRPEGNHVIATVGITNRNVKVLTHNRYGWDYQPAWSPDGRRLVFVRGATTFDGALYTVGARGGKPRLVWSGERPNHPAWSPDGRRIAVDGMRGQRDASAPGIRLITPGSAGFVELTHPPNGANDVASSWSPDGSEIAFVRRYQDAHGTGERVLVLTLATGVERALTPYGFSGSFLHPFAARWSPDGRSLAVITCEEPGWSICERGIISTMNPDGTGQYPAWDDTKLSALDVAWASRRR
jgi:Tol biopolymer transport system component